MVQRMSSRPLVACVIVLLLASSMGCLAHPDRVEDRLLSHFATGVKPFENGNWSDLTGHADAQVRGGPVLTNVGPARAVLLNGFTDWLEVASTVEEAQAILPRREFSVAAWVLLHDTDRDGGVTGLIQDNGDYEKGWLLGYNQREFLFLLSTAATDDGNGAFARLNGRTPLEVGRWHYLAATYDGDVMRLYLDGKEDGQSMAPSGDILYPENGRYSLGAYVDDNEFHPLAGAIFEVRTYGRVLSAEEIAVHAERNAALLAWRSPVNKELSFVVKPYLQFATPNSIVVMAETSAEAVMVVEYGEFQPMKLHATATAPCAIHELTLDGLKPFTRYFYRATCKDAAGNLAQSEICSFQTAPGPDAAWAFGMLGDTQRNPEVTRRCAEGIFALRPNMLLHCGDVVDDGFAKQQWVFDLFEPCANLLGHVPVFPVIGNHEKNSHWYYDYFGLPAPEYYYTFKMGNAQFFMIDSNKDCGPGSEQYQWLEKALKDSDATWKFTAHHHPCFSSDEDDYGDQWKGKTGAQYSWGDSNVRQLVPLYEKHGVDVALAGHIHSYERTWPILNLAINQRRGVRYIVSGGGGGGLEQAAPQRSWFTLHVARGHHYCFAVVHDRTIQFKAYDLEGRLFDTFELTKAANR
jgi:hypothetical protein